MWTDQQAEAIARRAAEQLGVRGPLRMLRGGHRALLAADDVAVKVTCPGERTLADANREARVGGYLHR